MMRLHIKAWSSNKSVVFVNAGVLLAALCHLLVADPEQSFLVFTGTLCFVAASLPFLLRKQFFLFEPPLFIMLSVFIGATLRAYWVAHSDSPRVVVLTDTVPLGDIATHGLLSVFGLATLSLGYLTSRKRWPVERLQVFRRTDWSARRLTLFCLFSALVSIGMLALLLIMTGADLSSLETAFKKRSLMVDDLAGGELPVALSYLRYLGSLSAVALLLLYLWVSGPRAPLSRAQLLFVVLLAAFLLVVVLSPGVFTSSRSATLVYVISMVVAAVCIRRKLKLSLAFGVAAFALFVLISLGLLREMREETDLSDFAGGAGGLVMDRVVGSGNFFPFIRTGVIVDRVPELVDYQRGATYATLLALPIPRQVWPAKPTISIGKFIKSEVYGRRTGVGGYPPGLVGEAYLNFGLAGVPLITFLTGMFLRVWYNSFRPLLESKSRNAVLVYSLSSWFVFEQTVELNFSLAVSNAMAILLISALALVFIGRRPGSLRRPSWQRFGLASE